MFPEGDKKRKVGGLQRTIVTNKIRLPAEWTPAPASAAVDPAPAPNNNNNEHEQHRKTRRTENGAVPSSAARASSVLPPAAATAQGGGENDVSALGAGSSEATLAMSRSSSVMLEESQSLRQMETAAALCLLAPCYHVRPRVPTVRPLPNELLRLLASNSNTNASGHFHDRIIVLDFETTGLSSEHDRIVEIGAVEVVGWTITGSFFHRVVNPSPITSHPRAERVHCLGEDELREADPISVVLPHFVRFLIGPQPFPFQQTANDDRAAAAAAGAIASAGSDSTTPSGFRPQDWGVQFPVIYSHNVRFDAAFLNAALQRYGEGQPRCSIGSNNSITLSNFNNAAGSGGCGTSAANVIPVHRYRQSVDAFCTMELFRTIYPSQSGSSSLDSVCHFFGVDASARQSLHSALVDARHCAEVLLRMRATLADAVGDTNIDA